MRIGYLTSLQKMIERELVYRTRNPMIVATKEQPFRTKEVLRRTSDPLGAILLPGSTGRSTEPAITPAAFRRNKQFSDDTVMRV